MDHSTDSDAMSIEPGTTVYDYDGEPLGKVTGVTDSGFEIEAVDPDNPDEIDQEQIPGQEFGEGYLMWRCTECGEMGDLDDGMPSTCPNCGAPKEALTEAVED